MPTEILYPSAVDYMRTIVDNTVDNLLAAKPGYVAVPSAYRRAYIVVHETGVVELDTDFEVASAEAAPDIVSITKDPRTKR
jgi:hypothetical protein